MISRFSNQTDSEQVQVAIYVAEQLLMPNSKAMMVIHEKNDFKYSSGEGYQVHDKLVSEKPLVKVAFYKPMYPWSSALGYFDGDRIFINYRKILDHKALVGLLLHEYAHYCGFHHSGNLISKEKIRYSVPYFLSSNVGAWI